MHRVCARMLLILDVCGVHLSVCLLANTRMCVRAHVCARMCVCICVHARMSVYICVHARMSVCICVHTRASVRASAHVSMCVYVCAYVCGVQEERWDARLAAQVQQLELRQSLHRGGVEASAGSGGGAAEAAHLNGLPVAHGFGQAADFLGVYVPGTGNGPTAGECPDAFQSSLY